MSAGESSLIEARLRKMAVATACVTAMAMALATALVVRRRHVDAQLDAALSSCACCEDLKEAQHVGP